MKHIASFSTGGISAKMTDRVIERYGRDAVTVVAMDTTIEDDDNYRFATDMALHWGVDFVWLREGRDPYQVGVDEHVIPNQKLAPCTKRLKIEPFIKYLASLEGPLTVHIGYDFTEVHRCAATTKNYEALGYSVDYPMLWKPYEFRSLAQIARADWGVPLPRMYDLGYTHSNCGGRCVKQGQGDWLRTLANFPERYAEAEAWEARMRGNPINADYALLRDQTEGTVRPMTLRELREEYEADMSLPLFVLDQKSACVVCGAGL